jgi:hypothetical protein
MTNALVAADEFIPSDLQVGEYQADQARHLGSTTCRICWVSAGDVSIVRVALGRALRLRA